MDTPAIDGARLRYRSGRGIVGGRRPFAANEWPGHRCNGAGPGECATVTTSTTALAGRQSVASLDFDGASIRSTPDGRFVAIDVLRALGQKDPSRAWRAIKSKHPSIQEKSSSFPFGKGGRSPDVLTEEGVYQLAMVAGGPKADRFREWAADLIRRFREGDPALAVSIIDRQEDPDVLRRIADRADARVTVKRLTQTIQDHGGTKPVFAKVNDINNALVTGMSARQILEQRGGKGSSRDYMDSLELRAIAFAQEAERQHIKNVDAQGNPEIMQAVGEVVSDILPIVKRYRKKQEPLRPAALPSGPVDDSPPGAPWAKYLKSAGPSDDG